MTNEEMERVMNFIIERQERVAGQQGVFAEQMNVLREGHAGHDERLTRLERLAEFQQGLLTSVIETQDRTSQDIRMLTAQVDRIAEAVVVLLDRTGGANDTGNGKA